MTAAVVGSYADWVGILAGTLVMIGVAGRMALAHTCRQTELWEAQALLLGVVGVTVLVVAARLPGWVSIPAAAVVLVVFPGLLVSSARRSARSMCEFDRNTAVRAADAAAGLGSASGVGAGSEVGGAR